MIHTYTHPTHTHKKNTQHTHAQGYFYYIFGFLFLVGILTTVVTIEVGIICTYVQLCAEDYLWWYVQLFVLLLLFVSFGGWVHGVV